MRAPRLRFVFGALAALVVACSDAALERAGAPCETDLECATGQLCLLGSCTGGGSQNLGSVDLLVSPLEDTGFEPQAFQNLDAQRATRHTLALRPTLRLSLRTCVGCGTADSRTVPGSLTLTAPSAIRGRVQVETATVDASGTVAVGLLDGVTYAPVLFPSDTALPLLYADPIFATGSGTLDVALPDPEATFTVEGRVVLDDQAPSTVAVEGAKVWVMQGETRLVRDVRTNGDGRFVLRVLRSTSSGLTVWVAPGTASQPVPHVAFAGINLDGNVNLGELSVGLGAPLVDVGGRVTGPDGRPLAGAQVELEGPAGAGTLRFSTVTDASGNFTGRVPAGRYARAVVPPAQRGAAIVQEANIAVGDGVDGGPSAPVTLDVQLLPTVALCGQVMDVGGVAVVDAAISAVRVANAEEAPGPASDATLDVRAMTGGDGRYCLDVSPGQYLLTGVPPAGSNQPSRTDLVNVGSMARTHDLRLPRAAFVVGTVQTPDGAPVRLARVKAFSPVLSSAKGALELGETYTQDDGTFTLVVPDLAGGTTGGASSGSANP